MLNVRNSHIRTAVCAASLLMLAACGTSRTDRAISGAGLGAGAGAAVGALTGGNIGTGAVIGGLAGGAAGALTDPCQFNLGDPVWKDKSRADYERQCGRR